MMNELYKRTARDMVQALKSGDVSPTDAVQAAFDRIESVDDIVHAMPTLCKDRAFRAASGLESNPSLCHERRDDPCWLAGLPVAVKDLMDVRGVRTTYGSSVFADHVPDESDLMVERLERNGAIVVGKSNTPEFGVGGNSFNEVFPATVTPWDTRLTAGGSSGGAAAALATGEVWLATGSDLGGSLRTPAGFCGVVGLRPSPGRVANGPTPLPFNTMSVEGPMARNVADTALFLDAMVGDHPRDPVSLPKPDEPFSAAVNRDVGKPRVAYSPDLGLSPVDPEISSICAGAMEKLSRLGWDVIDTIPDFSMAMETFQVLRAAGFATAMADLYDKHRDMLKPEIIWNIEKGRSQNTDAVYAAERARGALYHGMVDFFETCDLLICPTACMPPFPVETRYPDSLGEHQFETYMDWLTLPSALTPTACPVLSLPCGMTSAGLPVGIQLVAPHRGEAALLAAAHTIEHACSPAKTAPISPIRPRVSYGHT